MPRYKSIISVRSFWTESQSVDLSNVQVANAWKQSIGSEMHPKQPHKYYVVPRAFKRPSRAYGGDLQTLPESHFHDNHLRLWPHEPSIFCFYLRHFPPVLCLAGACRCRRGSSGLSAPKPSFDKGQGLTIYIKRRIILSTSTHRFVNNATFTHQFQL